MRTPLRKYWWLAVLLGYVLGAQSYQTRPSTPPVEVHRDWVCHKIHGSRALKCKLVGTTEGETER